MLRVRTLRLSGWSLLWLAPVLLVALALSLLLLPLVLVALAWWAWRVRRLRGRRGRRPPPGGVIDVEPVRRDGPPDGR